MKGEAILLTWDGLVFYILMNDFHSKTFICDRIIKKKYSKSSDEPYIWVILEESYNLFTHKRFGRMTGNWVTNWQPYLFLRFAVSCLT